jgi:hypothetical protein
MSSDDRQSNAKISAEGRAYVMQKLLDRGLVIEALPGHPPGVHLRVADQSGSWHANVQVRTSHKKVSLWPIGKSITEFAGPDCFYVFLRLDPEDAGYEVFLESAETVASGSEKAREDSLKRGNVEFPAWWELPKDEASRQRLREQWQFFGRAEP